MANGENLFAKSTVDTEIRKYRENAEWGLAHPTTQIRDLNSILQSAKETTGEIIDAGAGFGRNSVFLAREGFDVCAVEINKGAVPDLESNIKEGGVADRISIQNESIQRVLKDISNDSILAVIDSGMSHYLNDAEKEEFFKEVFRVLKHGGFITILHFSENEESNPQMGRSREFLEKFFPKDAFDIAKDWKEIKWTHQKINKKHSAWTAILKKI